MKKIIYFLIVFVYLQNGNAQITVGDSLFNTGNYTASINAYHNSGTSALKHFKIARVYQQLGATSKSIESYHNGFLIDSVNIQPRFNYGKLLLNTQQPIPAINVFIKLTNDQPSNASFHYYLGKGYETITKADSAIESYNKAVTLNTDYRSAHLGIVKNQIILKKYIEAIRYSAQYLNKNPNDTKMLSYNAQAGLKAKWYDKALESFKKLVELEKTTDYNIKGIATCYLQETEYEKALEYLDLYIKMYDDNNSGIYFQKAVALMKLNRYEEAIAAMETSIAIKRPALDQEYLQLAAIYARKDDLANAFKSLQTAQKENSKDPLIGYQLAIAADRYFADKNTIISYYQRYVDQFGKETTYGELAAARLSDLKKDVFMNGAQKN